jgi:hypothetical protein
MMTAGVSVIRPPADPVPYTQTFDKYSESPEERKKYSQQMNSAQDSLSSLL